MAARRIWYLTALAGCLVFYIAYGEWFSFLLLCAVLGLPWLSLLLSLPAILRFRISIAGTDRVRQGVEGEVWLQGSCPLPMPPFRGRLRMHRCITGETWQHSVYKELPTAHCGGILASVERARVCDYLGLFSFPVRDPGQKTILVRPIPRPIPEPPDLQRYLARAWKPKFGGGYAENHELRLYRPGDSLNQVHWKLSAKTGKLILREPMEPQRGLLLLTMTVRGTPEETDRKFGRLLWMGTYLLEQGFSFELRTLTADGVQSYPIASEQDFNKAVDGLLCCRGAETSIRDLDFAASWRYHIGGEPDEG